MIDAKRIEELEAENADLIRAFAEQTRRLSETAQKLLLLEEHNASLKRKNEAAYDENLALWDVAESAETLKSAKSVDKGMRCTGSFVTDDAEEKLYEALAALRGSEAYKQALADYKADGLDIAYKQGLEDAAKILDAEASRLRQVANEDEEPMNSADFEYRAKRLEQLAATIRALKEKL